MKDLKLISKYLGYKTKCILKTEKYNYDGMISVLSPPYVLDFYNNECEIKLILRPLSDLSKNANRKDFANKTYLHELQFILSEIYSEIDIIAFIQKIKYSSPDFILKQVPYFVLQKLIEWGFDVFGLIESGLAIDKNSL